MPPTPTPTPRGPKPRAATVEVRNCLNDGLNFRGAEVWCPTCRTRHPVAYDSIVNPAPDTDGDAAGRARRDRAIDIVLRDAFSDPFASDPLGQ